MAQVLLSGPGTFARLADVARELGLTHPLLVSDRGILAVGYVDQARRTLRAAGLAVDDFHEFSENPTSDMIEAGRAHAATLGIDGIIGLGGGSSMDCAKGINFVLTNGGTMKDYRGYGKAMRPMLPMIAVPTTAGTGSEAQSYALITDPLTHEKMACGDPKAAFAAAILDPALTVSQPQHVTASAGYDAMAHAVETWVTTRRNPVSDLFAREAWTLLSGSYERVLSHPEDLEARGKLLIGAHFAGAAIERSMLGATHACANAFAARYDAVHGVAIALFLRHVVYWNGDGSNELASRYRELSDDLLGTLKRFADAGGFPRGLSAAGASRDDLDGLSADAAGQWTGTFNPRPFSARGAREIYEMAW
jgi:alcohol dehydrogenase